VFHFDRGLKLTRADLSVDFKRRQPRGFISHAHSDHMARHELALCTPATADLYQHRLGPRPVLTIPYRQPLVWGGLVLTTYPAGHCLGSAMLLAQQDDCSLLYTGDFKLGKSATVESAELPEADILVLECTFGQPRYRLPPREEVVGQLIELVARLLASDRVPVVEAYALGKAQEVTALLTAAGFPVLQHAAVYAHSRIYEAHGVSLGDYLPYSGTCPPGHVVVAPPRMHRAGGLAGLARVTRIAVTGWAIDPAIRYRLGVDHALPLSDHADYDELLTAVERVGAREVYCTHGPESFAECLRAAGHNAQPLDRRRQKTLF